jgi:glucose-6-phosphate 1-dehydrogenase
MGNHPELSTTIVIFGASGDLCQRKLIPALFNLHLKGRLPPGTHIVGHSRRDWSDQDFRERMRIGTEQYAGAAFTPGAWRGFTDALSHFRGELDQPRDFANLGSHLERLEGGPANRLYYLAIPPSFFIPIVDGLANADLTEERDAWRHVVVEKPFGSDLASARKLNAALHGTLAEHQIYRIDHYLGKETVQNVLVFRFANTIFEPLWNRNYIDHVQITVAEQVGVGHRAGYYDHVGVLRDMFQNHLLQLLTLVAMEPPATFEANALRNEKTKVLSAVRTISPEQIADYMVRGQYQGYRSEDGVQEQSQTATFAAIKLFIDNWRWQGVPFYLRSGKNMAEKNTEITIHFKCPPVDMFALPDSFNMPPNVLSLCIQPDEGIHLRFDAKVPDTPAEMRPVDMDFHYAESFGGTSIPDAYERLLLDALHGDAALFTRSDEIELAWALIDPFVQAVRDGDGGSLAMYPPGSWGPKEAQVFIANDGRDWSRSCGHHSDRT